MACFISGILFTAFMIFIGVKAKRVKFEYGNFKEDISAGGGSNQPKNTKVN